MLTVTFTADEAMIEKLDSIGKKQQRPREMVIADAVAAYIERQTAPEIALGGKKRQAMEFSAIAPTGRSAAEIDAEINEGRGPWLDEITEDRQP